MAASSISSQLQSLKSVLNASTDPEPGRRRPLTRPSLLFDGKAAADVDLDTIFNLAESGLDVLIGVQERFRNYKSDLFSPQSKELDRELINKEENKRIDASISSFLRLLSGFLELPSALKTLEYLIRRYKIHVYNIEDLILCALPYHDTHTFVQIVQLIDPGNSKWKFLEGVKTSGARLPREVIVHQCIRDMGVLEAICNYATPMKKIQPSQPVVGFSSAVVFEVLGNVTIDSDIVKRILPYVMSGLQHGGKRLNQKAGALMIVGLLAEKATLAPNVVKSLLHSVADIAREESKERGDLHCLRMSMMAIISIIQLQSMELIPKKTVDVINDTKDILGILLQLTEAFKIDKFLAVLSDSLLEHSFSDELCYQTLLGVIETLPAKAYVNHIVSKLLAMRVKISKGKINFISPESGSQVKKLLFSICEKYPNESRAAFHSFLKDAKMQSSKVGSSYELLCKILDENLDTSLEVPDPKLFFALENSEAEIRRLGVLSLDVTSVLAEKAAGSKKFDAIQDALLRRLSDEDLNVVLAVLNLKDVTELLNSPQLMEALQYVLQRCTNVLLSGLPTKMARTSDVALLCLQQLVTKFKDQEQYASILAMAVFPLLLLRPKTKIFNSKALELAKELKWPLYENLVLVPQSEKKLDIGEISSINIENIQKLAEKFSSRPQEYIPWLSKSCDSHDLSKTIFFLVLLQSLKMVKMDDGQFSAFFDSCFPILKIEWERLESLGISTELCKNNILDGDNKRILESLNDSNINEINAEILACLFLGLSEAFVAAAPEDVSLIMTGKLACTLQNLFLFFVCHSKDVFKKHLDFLYAKCKISMTWVMLQLMDEGAPCAAQIEGLRSFSHACSQLDESSAQQILDHFPSLLVLLSSDNQNVRMASMNCIEELYALWSNIGRNGNNGIWLKFLGELLSLIIRQKKMILSDLNVLASFFTSLFSSSDSLLVHEAAVKRFDESTKDKILHYIVDRALELPAYAKLNILSLVKGAGSKLISVPEVRSLLTNLLESCGQLSGSELDILCLLLECCTKPCSHDAQNLGDLILRALQVCGAKDSTVVSPCLTILRNLSSSLYGYMNLETQEHIFRNLLILFRSANGEIQNAARDALLRIELNYSILARVLDSILDHKTSATVSSHAKKRKKSVRLLNAPVNDKESTLYSLSAALDVLLMKKDIVNRVSLVGPLFKLLHAIFTNDEWMSNTADQDSSDTTAYIHQTLLLTLEDICASIQNDSQQKDVLANLDMPLLVSYVRSSCDAVSRNHAFTLITTLVKVLPDTVLDHVLDILSAVGETTVTQWDSHSQSVFEGLISGIIPVWLSRNNDTDLLLQIFVNVLPQITELRRLSIMKHILRTLGEAKSLGSLFYLLFCKLVSRKDLSSSLHDNEQPTFDCLTVAINKQWEYEFAGQISEQYSCTIWLPSLLLALEKVRSNRSSEGTFMQMLITMQFLSSKLHDPEISYKLESNEDLSDIQRIIGELMEQVVYHLQLVDLIKKNVGVPTYMKSELKDHIRNVLKTLTKCLQPSTYFKVIIELIRHDDKNVKKKALGLLCETVNELDSNKKNGKKNSLSSVRSLWLHLNKDSLEAFENLCTELLAVLDAADDVSSNSLKLAAVSALEVLANKFPAHETVFSTCLGSVSRKICSANSSLSSHCLQATGALVNALGPRALRELPTVMGCVLEKSREISLNSSGTLFMSVLLTLEAIVDKLAGFLNPYLIDILKLVVLRPPSFSSSESKLTLETETLCKLITEKIPVRLLLPPVLSLYVDAVKCGGSSLSIVFEMLRNLVGVMDRSSIGTYHAKVFDLCLQALDLRRQSLDSIHNIDAVEQSVINTVVTLTMKLTESMFRPLFVKTIEWSNMIGEGSDEAAGKDNSRAIAFYGLVNKLAESHRSLFVPYFKYILDGCIQGLADEDAKMAPARKKKKAKLNSNLVGKDGGVLSLESWQLRALILSSLHKCFVYDTGSAKILDSSSFEMLLKPIISQLSVDPPESIEDHPNVLSIQEVDDLLVATVSQMAVTAASDLLWKPLNHEILIQGRSEKLRTRILSLRIVKSLLEKLKEEYLIFLPETMPSLAEWLEDMEPMVKSLAQDIRKELETLSGESLSDYL